MRCPFCEFEETQVKDSRSAEDGAATRRRRFCPSCGQRFTTFERIQIREMTVIKSGGRRQPFDRDKITRSMQIALQKRPVVIEAIERTTSDIVRALENRGEDEVPASVIGTKVMEALKQLDPIGYIRYASVYKDFNDLNDFIAEFSVIGASSAAS